MTEREGTPEEFARMMRGEPLHTKRSGSERPGTEARVAPKPEEDTEPTTDEQVVDYFTRTPERQEAERQFLDSLHKPYEGDDAA